MLDNNRKLTSNNWVSSKIQSFSFMESLNFLLTNRIPRSAATRMVGRLSRIRHPWFTRLAMTIWRSFVDDLALHEAKKSHFDSLHECFIRELKEGARPIHPDPSVITSPCDAVIGAHGRIDEMKLLQIKGYPYDLRDLLCDTIDLEKYRNGYYVTLRIKSSMYHRFHAPLNGQVSQLHYISGDTWNVNPVALKRVEKLFCKNERAVLEIDPADHAGHLALVPVAAILVASMKFHGIETTLDMNYQGPNRIDCDLRVNKGDEMGYFQHGSTIIVLASKDFSLHPSLVLENIIRVGQPLLEQTQIQTQITTETHIINR